MASTPANSCAALATTEGSPHTRARGPSSRASSSPTASATRYGAMGCGIAQDSTARLPCSTRCTCAAAISPRSARGTVSSALYVTRTRGVSCSGITERAWMAWHWLKRKGCARPAVCAGASHCSAEAPGAVE